MQRGAGAGAELAEHRLTRTLTSDSVPLLAVLSSSFSFTFRRLFVLAVAIALIVRQHEEASRWPLRRFPSR